MYMYYSLKGYTSSHGYGWLQFVSTMLLLSYYPVSAIRCYSCTSDDRKCPAQAPVDVRALQPVVCKSAQCLSVVGINDPMGVWRGCPEDSDVVVTKDKSGCYTEGRKLICTCNTDGCNRFSIGSVHMGNKTHRNVDQHKRPTNQQRQSLIKMAAHMSKDPWWRKSEHGQDAARSPKAAKVRPTLKVVEAEEEVKVEAEAEGQSVNKSSGPKTRAKVVENQQRKGDSEIEETEIWISAGVKEVQNALATNNYPGEEANKNENVNRVINKSNASITSALNRNNPNIVSTLKEGWHGGENVTSTRNPGLHNNSNNVSKVEINAISTQRPDTKANYYRQDMVDKQYSGQTDILYLDEVNQFLKKLIDSRVLDTQAIPQKNISASRKSLFAGRFVGKDGNKLKNHNIRNSDNRGLSLAEWNTQIEHDVVTSKARRGMQYEGSSLGSEAVHENTNARRTVNKLQRNGINTTSHLIDLLMRLLDKASNNKKNDKSPSHQIKTNQYPSLKQSVNRYEPTNPLTSHSFGSQRDTVASRNKPTSTLIKYTERRNGKRMRYPLTKRQNLDRSITNMPTIVPPHNRSKHPRRGRPRTKTNSYIMTGMKRNIKKSPAGIVADKKPLLPRRSIHKGITTLQHGKPSNNPNVKVNTARSKPTQSAKNERSKKPKLLRPKKRVVMETYNPPWMQRSTYILNKGLAGWGTNRRRQSRMISAAQSHFTVSVYTMAIHVYVGLAVALLQNMYL